MPRRPPADKALTVALTQVLTNAPTQSLTLALTGALTGALTEALTEALTGPPPPPPLPQDVFNFASPPIPEACADMYPGEGWKCIWSSYRLPLLTTPYFLNAAQFDAYQLMYAPNLSPSFPRRRRSPPWQRACIPRDARPFPSPLRRRPLLAESGEQS